MLTEPYLLKTITNLATNNNNPYQLLDLIDATKTSMRGIVWKPEKVVDESEGSLKEGEVYVFDADETEYNGVSQLTIHWAEKIESDKSSFRREAKFSPEELMIKFKKVISTVRTPSYRAVVKGLLSLDTDFFSKLQSLPKTTKYDYDYPGGLLQSIVYCVEIADQLSETFQLSEESRDLLICSAMVCDLGKITEITSESMKTDEGRLLGHQYLGCVILNRFDKDTDFEYHSDILKLQHCVITHHTDELGNWSPVKPQFIEADLCRMIGQIVYKVDACSKGK